MKKWYTNNSNKRKWQRKEWVKAHSLLLLRQKYIRGEKMAKSNTEKKVLPLLEPIVAERGLELVDLEFVKEGANWYLRVYIYKEGGVSIDDCEAVSRPLKKDADFIRFQGEIIDVKLYKAVDGQKQFQGKLLGLNDGVISLEEEDGTVREFVQKDTADVRLAVIF